MNAPYLAESLEEREQYLDAYVLRAILWLPAGPLSLFYQRILVVKAMPHPEQPRALCFGRAFIQVICFLERDHKKKALNKYILI